ncbi:GTP-binding ERG-like protein, partial [Trifolium medium]|nr:GTP-binding ERG-like protein [Trifolium medium]
KPNPTTIFRAFFSAEPLTPEPDSQPSDSDSTFDSSHYDIPISNDPPKPTWDEKNRKRAEKSLFGDEVDSEVVKLKFKEEEDKRKRRALAKALLDAALNKEEEDDN